MWTQRLDPPHPTAQSHIPEDLNPQQQHHCENPEKLQKTQTGTNRSWQLRRNLEDELLVRN